MPHSVPRALGSTLLLLFAGSIALQFHSQIPKIYTFQTQYSLSLCHSFLCLGSPCHPTANAKPTGFNTMPTALSKSCSVYQNIMTHLAYEYVNNSFFIQCYIKIEIIRLMQSLTDRYLENQLVQIIFIVAPCIL